MNSQNMRPWSAEKPHLYVESSLYMEKLSVWAVISGRSLIKSIFNKDNNLKIVW
jgi:hypothetical protein